ncbi:hypothetical protein ED733_006765 [Metarhizium rileyi]|uniref:Integral membrane protein TmpA n=1 Tax=Metarhizium rileyi (strain RCEF 4871) TaxID=1649241 RepID=A0A5C6GIG3_METRR|nr:hypothetical protein ED733_006765 [Metarhizium rileyi]
MGCMGRAQDLEKSPSPSKGPFGRNFYKYVTSYRKVFAVIFTINFSVFIALIVQAGGSPDPRKVGTAASANLLACILFRQEEWVNLWYEIFTMAPHSWPLCIRGRLAKIFHYGGCHSGAGTAAVVWYVLYTFLQTRKYCRQPETNVTADVVCSYILTAMFVAILTAAHPTLRRKQHDYFEMFHRFAGWTAMVAFWTHNIFAAKAVAQETGKSLGYVLATSANFWLTCVATCCTVASWSRLRRVDVYPEKLSDHATRLHFKHRAMKPFYGLKLSDRPLTEWHAFATIPDRDPATGTVNGFGVIVSNAGDWTREQIQKSEARKLWVRGAPLHGLLYTSRLFKQIVLVATGSGIGPCLSLLYANKTPCRVLWSTRDPRKTYGDEVVAEVQRADPKAVIWNTSERGYPNIVLEIQTLVDECNAEAVYVISNPKVTSMVVLGMAARGIRAYGAIFDS